VHEQIGVDHLLERRTERLDELMRRRRTKPTVSERTTVSRRKMQASHRGIERREQLVLHEDARVGEALSSVDLPAFV